MPYRTLRGLGDKRRAEIRRDAASFLDSLGEPTRHPLHQGDQTESAM